MSSERGSCPLIRTQQSGSVQPIYRLAEQARDIGRAAHKSSLETLRKVMGMGVGQHGNTHSEGDEGGMLGGVVKPSDKGRRQEKDRSFYTKTTGIEYGNKPNSSIVDLRYR